MIPTTTVNMLTVVHKRSDGIAISGPPDVCLTPGVGPVPYVNIAFSRDLTKGTRTVKVDKLPIAVKNSYFRTSYGDEPGRGGGVVSHVNKGKAKFLNYSNNVFAEGRNVCRLTDPMLMNGNQYNTTNPAEMQGNLLPDDLQKLLCKAFCWCDAGNKGKDFVKPKPGMWA